MKPVPESDSQIIILSVEACILLHKHKSGTYLKLDSNLQKAHLKLVFGNDRAHGRWWAPSPAFSETYLSFLNVKNQLLKHLSSLKPNMVCPRALDCSLS